MKTFWKIVAAAACLFISTSALAANAYVTDDVNLRTGPDRGYPRIMRLYRGTAVSIQGCVDGFEWCDVYAMGERGWIAGRFLQYDYDNRRVLVPAYGTVIGIPVVTFVFGSYWDNYYRSRSWYHDRYRWQNYHPRPPPRPPVHHPPKPTPPIHRPPTRPPVAHPPPRPNPPGTRPPPKPHPPGTRPPAKPKPPATTLPAPPPGTKPAPKPHPPSRTKPAPDKDKNGGGG